MSNTPIFDKLVQEFASRGKVYERMISPHLAQVSPLGINLDQITYTPDPHLDGPFKMPLPKRNLSHLIQVPEPDPELTRKMQEFIETAPLQILAKTPAGSFIQTFKSARIEEDNTITLEAEVAVPTSAPQTVREHKTEEPSADLLQRQLEFYRGISGAPMILDEETRYHGTGKLDLIPQTTYEDVVEATKDLMTNVKLSKTITLGEIVDGKTSSDAIQELGEEFAKKYPDSEIIDVNVIDEIQGGITVTVRGTNPKQTDESVNAASNEENDEPVFVAPTFWKIRDEE